MNTFDISVLTENSSINNVFDMASIEETYLYTTLKYIKETRSELRENTKELYKNILESGNDQYVINESFSSFFDKAKEIISKFLKYIKSLFDRFINMLHRFVMSDKYLQKHKKDLSQFTSEHEFDIQGYNFTFDPNVPVIEALAEFKKEFVGLDFDEMIKKDTKDMTHYIVTKYNKLKEDLNNNYYDSFRAKTIGESGDYNSSEFHEKLFEKYRDGDSSKTTITIDSTKVTESLIRFENYKDFEKQTKKTKEQIEKDYKEIESLIKKMVSKSETGDLQGLLLDGNGQYTSNNKNINALPKEAVSKLDLFIKTKVNQVVEMSNIHSLAFSMKLDAIAACYKQDKHTLYKALNNIQKKSWKKEGSK